jgi:hypothetical protein
MMPRKSFSEFDLASALEWVGILETEAWEIPAATKEPSAFFEEKMRRLVLFDTSRSEGAKLLLVDAFFEEAGQPYTNLRIFKETTIQGERSGGLLDYLVAPRGAVPTTPFVCVTEAKKDDFDKGLAQCLVEMQTSAELNTKAGKSIDVFGIVTNGQGWQFYLRTTEARWFGTQTYAITDPPRLLGILDYIFSRCAKNRH